jgi:hypothetical protein
MSDVRKGAVEEVKPSDNHNGKRYEEPLVSRQPRRSSQEYPLSHDVNQPVRQTSKPLQQSKNLQEIERKQIEDKTTQQRPEKFPRNQQETAQKLKPPKIQLGTQKIKKVTGIIVGVATLSWIVLTLGFSQKAKVLETQSLESNQTLSQIPKLLETQSSKSNLTLSSKPKLLGTKPLKSNPTLSPKPVMSADGWIFLGNINKASAEALGRKSLIKSSQLTNSPVVPSVGSIVTVTVRPGLTLRKNRPQKPKFNYKEQKALAIVKPGEKLKILKVESVTPSDITRPATQVWAKVRKCASKACS